MPLYLEDFLRRELKDGPLGMCLRTKYVTEIFLKKNIAFDKITIPVNRNEIFCDDFYFDRLTEKWIKTNMYTIGSVLEYILSKESKTLIFSYESISDKQEIYLRIRESTLNNKFDPDESDVLKIDFKTLIKRLSKYENDINEMVNDERLINNYYIEYKKFLSIREMFEVDLHLEPFYVPLSKKIMNIITYEILSKSSIDKETFIWSKEFQTTFFVNVKFLSLLDI